MVLTPTVDPPADISSIGVLLPLVFNRVLDGLLLIHVSFFTFGFIPLAVILTVLAVRIMDFLVLATTLAVYRLCTSKNC